MKFLVTGAAGFIGFHVCKRLLCDGHEVVGLDNLNDYYDMNLKKDRLLLLESPMFKFYKIDISDTNSISDLFKKEVFEKVIHLAAQAGVRYSIENPYCYVESNLVGHLNILEGCRHHNIKHLIYASSSSVYGLNNKIPFSTEDSVDHPVSLYAATKKANELMAHTYSHLYNIPTTGLRFFTVYGPWGRPDMALFKFTKSILDNQNIDVYNYGKMKRDFTYIDDIVESIIRLKDLIPIGSENWTVEHGSAASSSAPYSVFNIGNSSTVELMDYIKALEDALGMSAKLNLLPMQAGDVLETCADTTALYNAIGYRPHTEIDGGIRKFVDWYKSYYKK